MGQQRQAHRPSNKTPRRRRERPGRATRQGNRLQNAQGCESHQGAWSPTSRRERKEDDLGPQTHERWKEIGPRECQEKRKNPAGWPMNFIQVRRTPDQMLRIITKSPRDKEELYKTHKRAKALNAILEFQASITPSFQEYTASWASLLLQPRLTLVPNFTMRVGGWTLTLFWLKVSTPQNNFMFIAYWFYVGLFCVISLEFFVLPYRLVHFKSFCKVSWVRIQQGPIHRPISLCPSIIQHWFDTCTLTKKRPIRY